MIKSTAQEGLENSYKLATPDDNVAYYRGFAQTYDSDFVEQMGYRYPSAVAEAYLAHAADDVPIADIGCGTGIIAAELKLPREAIDGMDISPEMLSIARVKALYRNLFEVDLTGDLEAISNGYGAVLSAGTFTFGHLGPEPLRNLLRIARPGALFVIGVNQAHFGKENFSGTLDRMTAAGEIGPVDIADIKIYCKEGHNHSADRALILRYRKT
jgi:predicted TPR repeat methyltransferase